MINEVQIFIMAIVFVTVFGIYNAMTVQLQTAYKKAILVINNSIEIEKKRFDFSKTIEKYRHLGVLDKQPQMEQPYYYIMMHLLMSLVGALFLFLLGNFTVPDYQLLLAVAGIPCGWFALEWYYKHRDSKDNSEMVSDILAISNILVSQIKGGVYIGDALSECTDIIYNERLKKAFSEFDRHMKLQDMTLIEATDDLESKFNNLDLSSLCMIVRQSEENGHLQDILNDLSKQISDTQAIIANEKKLAMDRSLTIAMLIMFIDVIGYVLYIFIIQIFQNM